jgi:hypothetical protein
LRTAWPCRTFAAALAFVALAVAAHAADPGPIREGGLERLVLDDGSSAAAGAWTPAEATVTADAAHVRYGATALHFHVDVNWLTGEPGYPIGWPRMRRQWPAAARDWAGYDYVELSIFATSSRTGLPLVPMGLELLNAQGRTAWERDLTELKLGRWVDFRIPVADLARALPCSGMQVYISEANYKHLDVLDFWIDRISLVRYTRPTVAASRLAEEAINADSRYLTVELHVMGLSPQGRATVAWQIARPGGRGKPMAAGTVDAAPGRQRCYLSLPPGGLPPGSYQVSLRCPGDTPTPFTLTVAPSPWREVSR